MNFLARFNKSWLRWALFTSAGSGLGFMVVSILSLYSDESYFLFLAELAILGFFTGFGQWYFLRTSLRNAWLWILATTLGFILGYDAYGFMLPHEIYILLSPVSIGLFVGIFRSLVVRRTLKVSLQWIMVSIVSWNLAYQVVLSIIHMKTDGFIMGAITGFVIGAISGLFLDLILTESETIKLSLPQGEASYRLTAVSRGKPEKDQNEQEK